MISFFSTGACNLSGAPPADVFAQGQTHLRQTQSHSQGGAAQRGHHHSHTTGTGLSRDPNSMLPMSGVPSQDDATPTPMSGVVTSSSSSTANMSSRDDGDDPKSHARCVHVVVVLHPHCLLTRMDMLGFFIGTFSWFALPGLFFFRLKLEEFRVGVFSFQQ